MRKRVRKKLLARYGARTYAGAELAKRRWLFWHAQRRAAIDALRDCWIERINASIIDQLQYGVKGTLIVPEEGV